ncbi:GNAT family N-acetyltransferase [Maricaulis sp. CAU 1757]
MREWTARLETPSALAQAERDAWEIFRSEDSALDSPYFSLDFAECCEQARNDTRILVMRQGGAVRGFLPLQAGRFGYTRPLAGPLGDVHGVIAEPGCRIDLQACLAAARIPVFEFHSALAMQAAFQPLVHAREGGWMMDLRGGYEAWLDSRRAVSSKIVRNIRSKYRKLETLEGEAVFTMEDRAPDVLPAMLGWKREQYARTGVFDVFSVRWTRRLMEAVLARRGPGLNGVASSLRVNGELAAVHVGMRSERSVQYWFPAYSPAHAHVSPGLLLLVETARWAAQLGCTTIELGKGDYAFKKDLASYQVALGSGYWAAPCALGMARRAGDVLASRAETAPLGRAAHWPAKALRKLDRIAGFHAA